MMGDRSKVEARREFAAKLAKTMRAPRPALSSVRCSFCSKAKSEVAHIFAGPSAFICDECLDTLGAALAERRR